MSIPTASSTRPTLVCDLNRLFQTGRTRDLRWRLDQLRGIERLCDEREPDIAAALAQDLGRPAVDAWLGDIASTKAEAVFARKNLKRWMRARRVRLPLHQLTARGWVQYDPLGVILVIGPWNYPVYLSLAPLVAAVAAGNCAVLKPSELAPNTSELLARLIPQYLDSAAVRVVEGDASVTQDLMAQGFDHVLFTGGTEVGRKIMASAAATLTPVTLELGGKSPVIVAADANIDVAARRIAWVKLLNSGQTCIAPDYVLAERRIADELISKIAANLRQFRSDTNNSGQPIVTAHHFDRLVAMIDDTQGAIAAGGGSDPASYRIEPTSVVDPSATDTVMTDEIFGPILPIMRLDSLDTAAEFVNDRPKPLALYVFTESQMIARALIDRIPSGGAVVNHVAMQCLVPQLPFGGIGASGMGAYHGHYGFETLSHRRSVLATRTRPDARMVYPPYSTTALAILRRVF